MVDKKTLPTVYDPSKVETKWYDYWEEKKFFHAEVDQNKKPYSIVIPPPNVTGSLHMGHALNNTLQDILIRWRRMKDDNVVWIPGTDHAGIATQVVVEKKLAQEGLTRHDLGREAFIDKVWEWKDKYGNTILEQLKRLGASCDWDRERFTMDERCSKAVRTVFIHLYEKGLIYQGNFIINWCPRCLTALSDLEVEYEEIAGHLHYVKYPIEDSPTFIKVATTRPETILGDTAIAVHPDDERFNDLIGKTAVLPIIERKLPIIADEYVDPSFGTGAVKVTPAHDPNDFAIAQRHGLESVTVIDEHGRMNENAGRYDGMDRYECRKEILNDLQVLGLLAEVEDNPHSVGHCSRCDAAVEPLLSRQWFVRMKPLAEPAMEVVEKGTIKFVPARFKNTYMHWLENIHDWCISRQLWWGHRIPAWYCDECRHVTVAMEEPDVCEKCESGSLRQDQDVLDTWFSSALWPFSTLGWPEKTPELEQFYPTAVLVTGYDIIFFWVARMIFMGLEFMDEIPFHEVFINGLIRDAEGKKMSKSRGNTMDPLEIIEEYGTDTLRYTLVTGSSPGSDIRLFTEKFEGIRNFANKIWNASRFVMMNLDEDEAYTEIDLTSSDLALSDRWILSRSQEVLKEVDRLLARYDIGEAGKTLYDFIWSEFCDWYIELAKPRLNDPQQPQDRKQVQHILWHVLKGTMEMMHPFMPFITEEIWQHLPHEGDTIMYAAWPEVKEELIDEQAVKKMNLLMEIVRIIRNIRVEMNVKPAQKVDAILQCSDPEAQMTIGENQSLLEKIAGLSSFVVEDASRQKPKQAMSGIVEGVEVFVPLQGLIDPDKEISRLNKELSTALKELEKVEKKLVDQEFIQKAPSHIVEKEKSKQSEFKEKAEKTQERIKQLKELKK